MTEAKPICVMRLPETTAIGRQPIDYSVCFEIQTGLQEEKPDYYWFVVIDYEIKSLKFEVFYAKDFTEIQFEELKKIIEDSINKKVSNAQRN